eukprot:CAMPEP_0206188460 /NCGR_PEP_ID=MMETSP0166-20121206/3583_1 /ASSEMBLY_ACC=CAM_ASM_000260 /TAXON_ID=95228 /ORGANISM="Vannella robusta, Strain DIVA3 518/3/11/1/6" /LENGTH=242 /DNA_ID=CAMNT_0053604183 /DNA_START=186 /DNA_END=911 /DNA_ORIENTATION=+
MKGIVVLLALLSLSTAVIFNDTCDLVGSFNEYYAGVSVDLEFGNSLTVTVPNGLQVPNNTVIMIIQMQGGEIDTSESPEYGTVQESDEIFPGRYEFNVVTNVELVSSNTIACLEYLLEHEYSSRAPNYRFQIISVPFCNDTIITPGSWTPWNGISGGVVTLITQHLKITGDIDLSGIGFRGGIDIQVQNNVAGRDKFAYRSMDNPSQAPSNAVKGEGFIGSPRQSQQEFSTYPNGNDCARGA